MFDRAEEEFFRYNIEGYPSTFVIEEDIPQQKPYKITKVAPYFYRADFTDIDYDLALEYFKQREVGMQFGMCSGVRKNNLFGRQLDWIYNDSAEFVTYTPRKATRNAVIGIAGSVTTLTQDFVDSGIDNGMYNIVPFQLQDGVNAAGVFASINVVPTDKGENKSIPYGLKEVELPALMLVRFILDNFTKAKTAVEYIRDHVSVYFPSALHRMHYESHFMIGDLTDTYCLEFVNNRAVIIDFNNDAMFHAKPYMTNFHLHGVILNADGTVYTPATLDADHTPGKTNLITPNGSGLERYNLISNRYNSLSDYASMRSLLNDLTYTQAYSTSQQPADPFWYTEFVGANNLTVNDPASVYTEVVDYYGDIFSHRTRTDQIITWQTTHSVIYDLQHKSLHVIPQESGIEYTFSLGG